MSTRVDTAPSTTAPGEGSLLDWLLRAGINADRARKHLAAGYVILDGAVVIDPGARKPVGSTVDLRVPLAVWADGN